MNCTQCGSPLSEGSLFCQACGSPVNQQPPVQPAQAPPPEAPAQPQPIYQQPPTQPYGTPPYNPIPQYKKRTKLVVSLLAVGVVFIAAAVCLYLFVLSGTPVVGQWYCEERGQVLVFNEDNTAMGYALTGTVDGEYTYDKGKGDGAISANGSDLAFKVNKDELILVNKETDDESTFVKTNPKDKAEDLVLSALQGVWHCEEIGEVLEFRKGKINVYSGYGDFNGTYDYDIEKGQGSFSVNGKDFEFFADYNALSVTNTGNYVKADKKFDIKAFVAEHAMPIAGMWYDASGTYGTIEFYTDGTAQIAMLDMTVAATYTFDAATGTGTLTSETVGQSSDMALKDGRIEIDGITYTRDVVEQANASAASTVAGTWYETTGTLGSITFYEDGSLAVDSNGMFIYGTYTFNAADGSGQIELEEEGLTNTYTFSCDGISLQIEGSSYTRDYVEPVSVTTITGIWYDITGESGTVTLYDDGTCLFDCYGTVLTGTYTFDDVAGTGSLTIDDPSDPLSANLKLDQGYLYLDTIQYTRDYVAQKDYSN